MNMYISSFLSLQLNLILFLANKRGAFAVHSLNNVANQAGLGLTLANTEDSGSSVSVRPNLGYVH